MLQDMVVSARSMKHSLLPKKDHEAEMEKITGPMNIPGLF